MKIASLSTLLLAVLLPLASPAGESYRISDPAGSPGVFKIAITPDATRAIYTEGDPNTELWSAPLAPGGTPVKLSTGMRPGARVALTNWSISPDSTRACYMADASLPGVYELFSVPVAGGAPVRISQAFTAGGVEEFPKPLLTPDGSRVIYCARLTASGPVQLYSAPFLGGSAPVQLSAPGVSSGDFAVSPDSSRVVYQAGVGAGIPGQLHSVPASGGVAVRINGPTAGADGNPAAGEFKITTDSSRVVYLASQTGSPLGNQLFSAPISGGVPIQLNAPLAAPAPGILPEVTSFKITPDGSRAIYTAHATTAGVIELLSVPVGGGAAVKLNGAIPPGAAGVAGSLSFSPDSSRVFFLVRQAAITLNELYSAPIAGGAAAIRPITTAPFPIESFQLSPDGGKIIFTAIHATSGQRELFSLPSTGGAPVKLNGVLPPGGNVYYAGFNDTILITPDSTRVVYYADQNADDRYEVFSVPIGGGTSTTLNGPMTSGGDAAWFKISPDNSRVVYVSDEITDNLYHVYVARGPETWTQTSGDWDLASLWPYHLVPDFTTDVVIAAGATVKLTGNPLRSIETLTLGGSTGKPSRLQLISEGQLSVRHGITFLDDSVISGDGHLFSTDKINLPAGATLSAAAGEEFEVTGLTNNQGNITITGEPALSGGLVFHSKTTNELPTGVISVADGFLEFLVSCVNEAEIRLTNSRSVLYGPILNTKTGTISSTDNGERIFYGPMQNAGTISTDGGTLTFNGPYSGEGISGKGNVIFYSTIRPGPAAPIAPSAGLLPLEPDITLKSQAVLQIEIGGASKNQYDRLTTLGSIILGGRLDVTFFAGYVPTAGTTFQVWDAASATGGFASLQLPGLPSGLYWQTAQLNLTGDLSVGTTPETYATFAALYALTTPADGDQDADGLPNLLEYALGRNPILSDRTSIPGLPLFSRNGTFDFYSFSMPALIPDDVVLQLQYSTDLTTWTNEATRSLGGPWIGGISIYPGTLPGWTEVSLALLNGGINQRYFRLRASMP